MIIIIIITIINIYLTEKTNDATNTNKFGLNELIKNDTGVYIFSRKL